MNAIILSALYMYLTWTALFKQANKEKYPSYFVSSTSTVNNSASDQKQKFNVSMRKIL